jgi:hypothetical protein
MTFKGILEMNFEIITDIVAIVGAIALIVSLVFVAVELKKNVEQSITTNWYERVEKNRHIREMLLDKDLAAVVEKGDESFHSLDGVERLRYSSYMELVVINLIFNVVASDHASPQVKNLMDFKVGKNESENWNKARIRYYFNKNGVTEWFKYFNEVMPMPPHFHAIISSAIGRKIDAIGV